MHVERHRKDNWIIFSLYLTKPGGSSVGCPYLKWFLLPAHVWCRGTTWGQLSHHVELLDPKTLPTPAMPWKNISGSDDPKSTWNPTEDVQANKTQMGKAAPGTEEALEGWNWRSWRLFPTCRILWSHRALQNVCLMQSQASNTWCCSLCNKPLRPLMNESVKALPSCVFSIPIHFSLDSLWIWNLPGASNGSLKRTQPRNFPPFPKTWNFFSNFCILRSWNWDISSPVFYSCNIARSDIFPHWKAILGHSSQLLFYFTLI